MPEREIIVLLNFALYCIQQVCFTWIIVCLVPINFNCQKKKFLGLSIIIVLHSNAPYSSVLKVNNLFDKLESLNQGWVMSHVVHDVKFLESPFPRGSRRERMQFCCWPRRCDSFKVYKVIMGIKVV